jgi:hypothetical protein
MSIDWRIEFIEMKIISGKVLIEENAMNLYKRVDGNFDEKCAFNSETNLKHKKCFIEILVAKNTCRLYFL